jgi:hypothetical protein
VAIWRLSRDSLYYKLMLAMGVVDMANLMLVGVLTGIFGVTGIVYCSSPQLIYTIGSAMFCTSTAPSCSYCYYTYLPWGLFFLGHGA